MIILDILLLTSKEKNGEALDVYLVYLDPMFGSFLELLLWREPIFGEFFLQGPEFLNWQLISYIEPVSCGLFVLQLFSEYLLLVAII